jgi:hypothetical protein
MFVTTDELREAFEVKHVAKLVEALEQPQQEPVAWKWGVRLFSYMPTGVPCEPLYRHPLISVERLDEDTVNAITEDCVDGNGNYSMFIVYNALLDATLEPKEGE